MGVAEGPPAVSVGAAVGPTGVAGGREPSSGVAVGVGAWVATVVMAGDNAGEFPLHAASRPMATIARQIPKSFRFCQGAETARERQVIS